MWAHGVSTPCWTPGWGGALNTTSPSISTTIWHMTKGFLCIVIQSFDTGAKTAILQARTLRTRQVKWCVNSELVGGTQVWVLAPQGSCLTPRAPVLLMTLHTCLGLRHAQHFLDSYLQTTRSPPQYWPEGDVPWPHLQTWLTCVGPSLLATQSLGGGDDKHLLPGHCWRRCLGAVPKARCFSADGNPALQPHQECPLSGSAPRGLEAHCFRSMMFILITILILAYLVLGTSHFIDRWFRIISALFWGRCYYFPILQKKVLKLELPGRLSGPYARCFSPRLPGISQLAFPYG